MSFNRHDDSSNFHYIYSCDLESNVKIKVGTLEGKLHRPSYEQVIKVCFCCTRVFEQ